jgi:UDP-N-acetylmuramate--alanine ligase
MSGLARWYADTGWEVDGCDLSPGPVVRALRQQGICVAMGHSPDHLPGADRLIFSAAVPEDCPELRAARRMGIPALRRSEALAELTEGRELAAVAGAHGKTTTTSMAGWALAGCGKDPTVMLGGQVPAWSGNYRPGAGPALVEADEYDRAFLRLRPDWALVTSFAAEHLECYGSVERLEAAFEFFLELTPPGGSVVLPADLVRLARWADRIGRRVVTTGPGGDVRVESLGSDGWGELYRVAGVRGRLPVPGALNLRNLASAVALCREMGVAPADVAGALEDYPGVCRRLERIGTLEGASAVSDYAHHPEEVEAAIAALRRVTRGSLGVVFQPHLYSRTGLLHREMGRALAGADWSVVVPIYPARERPVEGVTSALVADACTGAGGVCTTCRLEELKACLSGREADTVAFMGAGTIDRTARELVGGGPS